MRFFQFAEGARSGTGLVGDGAMRGLREDEAAYPGTLDSLVRQGAPALAAVAERLSQAPQLDERAIRFLPPLTQPGKIICVGLNYRDHSAESGFEQPPYPTLFARFVSSLVGHRDPMLRPAVSDTLDFEGEMVAVIGTGGRHIAPDAALSHVMGYSVFNEGSVREFQFKAPQWTVGKNFDGTGAFGPWLVTADELPPGGRGLRLTTRLNGELVQSASTDDMVFDVATLVSVISEAISLEPGDILVTGTPSGVGHARTPPLYMRPGDVCEVEIERIGCLSNTIMDEPAMARVVA